MNAWLFQDHRQKQKLGEKCPWSVGWIDPAGKRKSKTIGCESLAKKFQRKIEGELAAGSYQSNSRKHWADFTREYRKKIAEGMAPTTRQVTLEALAHFERIIDPQRLDTIRTQRVDEYVSIRRLEAGKKKNSTVSPATVNKELRHLKSVLRIAHDWGYLPTLPKVRMLKEPKKLARYILPNDFAKIYQACDTALRPSGLPYDTADWWRGLLVFGYMTGWRVGEPLSLRRDDLDLEAGAAITRHHDNKGNRDDRTLLHPVVVEHLRKITSFDPLVFPWPHHRRTLDIEFDRIQTAAGIKLACHERHEHTDSCHLYGFHDLRRAFATMNAETLTADALQALMRHKSYQTTQRYINMARQLNRAVQSLYVPLLEVSVSTG